MLMDSRLHGPVAESALVMSESVNRLCLMGLSGLEPPTSRLSGVRSNRLSYKPTMEMEGIEPLTPCLQGRCSPS